jgi:chemotaxis protein methyltransferase CheR
MLFSIYFVNNTLKGGSKMAFTYFFRDMQTLDLLIEHALPVLKSRQRIKIWDAGCAMGPEPYSLAMMIRDQTGYMYFRNIRIIASDIDTSDSFEKTIKDGEYPRDMVERIDKDIFHKYFKKSQNSENFILCDEIKSSVTFKKHDLLSYIPVDTEVGLILCKNVLLHFSEEERCKVIQMFYDSLIPEGFLVMEQTQNLPYKMQDKFRRVVSNAQIYQKVI